MKSLVRALSAAGLVSALVFGACAAHADPADYLKSQLAQTPAAGQFLGTFPAPDTLTGVVIGMPDGHKMVGYVTPSGRYLISGVVIDLNTNQNLTQQYAAKYAGFQPAQPQVVDAKTVYEIGKAGRIVFGNKEATSYIAVVFDPATAQGKRLMQLMMERASSLVNSVAITQAHFDFIPYGPDAAALLQGSNQQRLKNMLDFVQGRPLPAPDKSAQTWAQTNNTIVKGLKVLPPLMVVSIPSMKEAKAVSLAGANNSPDGALVMFEQMMGEGGQSK